MRHIPSYLLLAFVILSVLLVRGGMLAKAGESGAQSPSAPTTGFTSKKPVFGGSCETCPWGVAGRFVKEAAKPYGYDVQICYNCGRGVESIRLVAGAKMPPPARNPILISGVATPPPNGPVDFGATNPVYLWWAYQGTHDYASDGPRKDLRLLGVLQHPNYLVVAVKADSGITDLRDIKDKHLPVHILTGVYDDYKDILAYYGLTKESVEAAGGHIAPAMNQAERKNFDVIIIGGALENAPEWNVLYEMSQKYDLKYLQLPDDLLDKLAKDFDMDRGNIPVGFLRGVDHAIPTVTQSGEAIYGRADMPKDFAYTIAKAMDEHQDLLQWSGMNVSYNLRTVWKDYGVPLHPGAERYYRERHYMK